MIVSSIPKSKVVALAGLLAALALAAFTLGGGLAQAAESPPENTTPPSLTSGSPMVVQVLTANPGGWTKGATKFTYQWKRCSFSTCTAIPGAESERYRVKSADVGNRLSVSVTAYNEVGSTTAESNKTGVVAARLGFYQCRKFSELPEYSDSSCTTSGGSNSYVWVRPTTQTFTSSNREGGSYTGGYLLQHVYGGILIEEECASASGSFKVEQGEVNVGNNVAISEDSTQLSECVVLKPAGQGCKVAGAKITLNPLSGATSPGSLTPKVTLEPSGKPITEFSLENCVKPYSFLNGFNYAFYGSVPTEISTGRSPVLSIAWQNMGDYMFANGQGARILGASRTISTFPTEFGTAP